MADLSFTASNLWRRVVTIRRKAGDVFDSLDHLEAWIIDGASRTTTQHLIEGNRMRQAEARFFARLRKQRRGK